VRGLFVGDGLPQVVHPPLQRDELALQRLDLFLVIEDGLGEFGILALEMRVADLEIDEAAFHGREAYQRCICIERTPGLRRQLGMSQRFFLVTVIAFTATAFPSLAAAAVADPLLVVVETAPGAGVDAVEVRQAITEELGTAVRAPRDGAAPDTPDLLIVAVDRAEIRMSLRAGVAGAVSRAVPAPGDRKARLQSIGWLAGNLARDQIGPLVAWVPAPGLVSGASAEGEPSARAEVPPPPAPAPRLTTDPPPFADNAARDTAGTSGGVVSTGPSAAAAGSTGPTWSLAVGGGPSLLYQGTGDRDIPTWPGPGVWYLELQRRASSDGLILGAALDVGPDMQSGIKSGSIDFIGAAALVGGGLRFRRIFVEATGGLGLEAYNSVATVRTETGTTIESQGFSTVILGLYLRGQATAGVALSKYFDVMASLGGHLGSVGKRDAFLTSSLGVRFRF